MRRKKPGKRARILIIDDHQEARDALALRINRQPDLKVCGKASDVSEALHLIVDTDPDVVVVDISLKTGNGIDLIRRIKDRNAHVGILVWSMHSEALYAERALLAGALGYINKDQAEKFLEAIARVLAGKVWLSEVMKEEMLQRIVGSGRNEIPRSPLQVLADRELEVFRLIGAGMKTAEIAARLHLSIKTVETYRHRIRQKLNLANGAKLAHYATRWVLENE
jgi:DNA-binding NarL/FixJ family response regulator